MTAYLSRAQPLAKPDCNKCVHRITLPGDAHIRCNNHSAKVVGDKHGIRMGWFMWPFNFDPAWLLSCDGFSENEEDKLPVQEIPPIFELMSLLK